MRAAEFIVENQSGLDFKVSKDTDGVSIKANAGGKQLGYAEFFYDDDGNLDPQAVWVDERFQGQGIGGSMYDYLKRLGYTIIRSWDQTDAGKGMWDKHRGADVNVWEDNLNESLSRVAYHYTGLGAANKILQSGNFELSSAPGSIEQQYAPPGKPYFLSTTRTKTGGYHSGSKWRGVMFVLDGNWFNQRYKSSPLDYWGNRGSGMRASEAEDRVFSAEPTIPVDGVSAVHVFVAGDQPDDENLQANRAVARQVLIAAKTRGIPAYFYNNHDAWLAQDTRRAASVSQLTGTKPNSYYRGMRRRTYMHNWLELMGATQQNQLSKDADKTRYNLNYDYDRDSAAKSLEVDMANARKPDSGPERETAVKIIRYMNQHRLNTIRQFVDHIAAKWKTITSANK